MFQRFSNFLNILPFFVLFFGFGYFLMMLIAKSIRNPRAYCTVFALTEESRRVLRTIILSLITIMAALLGRTCQNGFIVAFNAGNREALDCTQFLESISSSNAEPCLSHRFPLRSQYLCDRFSFIGFSRKMYSRGIDFFQVDLDLHLFNPLRQK